MDNWTVKSVNDVPVEELNKPTEEIAPAQESAMEGPKVPQEEAADVEFKINPDAVQKPETENVPEDQQASTSEEVVEEVRDGDTQEEGSPLELIQEESPEKVEEAVPEAAPVVEQEIPKAEEAVAEPQVNLPENVEKLISFMEETGGSMEDYVNLNKDLDAYSDNDLLFEYYKQTKGWDAGDIREHIQDEFSFDKELDDPKDIRAKERNFKAELRTAKRYLQDNRDKYYADLKLRPRQDVDPQYQEAFDFHTSYKEQQTANKQLQDAFLSETDSVFNDLKGFDFKVGDATYRYKVADPGKVKTAQSDINNFVKPFLSQDGTIKDAKGYHRALFAARNVDKLVAHFYEQGRADALKTSAAEAKNIDMGARGTHDTTTSDKSGPKVRVVDSDNWGSKLKIKNYSRT